MCHMEHEITRIRRTEEVCVHVREREMGGAESEDKGVDSR